MKNEQEKANQDRESLAILLDKDGQPLANVPIDLSTKLHCGGFRLPSLEEAHRILAKATSLQMSDGRQFQLLNLRLCTAVHEVDPARPHLMFDFEPEVQIEYRKDRMSNSHYVKHPIFPPESLDGRRLAYCECGNHFPYNLRVQQKQEDGKYVLVLWRMQLVYRENEEGTINSVMPEAKLDQETVNKIIAPESGSLLQQMAYPFAIVQDSESEYLAKKG